MSAMQVQHAAHYVPEEYEDQLPLAVQATLATLRRVDFSRFPMRTAMRFDAALAHGMPVLVRATVRCWVVDREDPEGKRVITTDFTQMQLHEHLVRFGAVEWVRSVLRRVVEHELDECLFAGGVRYRDPHDGGRVDF